MRRVFAQQKAIVRKVTSECMQGALEQAEAPEGACG